MFGDDPLFLAILDEPSNAIRRSVYADWLQERGDPRGDYLRLLLELQALSEGDPRIAEIEARLRLLRPSVDRHWVAIIHDLDGLVREVQTIRLRISTYGPAPKQYTGATKVLGRVGAVLLIKYAGWQDTGREKTRHSYYYLRRPPGARARNPSITVEVPTDAAIERLAVCFRQSGEKTVTRNLEPWTSAYQEKDGVEGQDGPIRGAASLKVELSGCWSVSLAWKAGEEHPVWSRMDRYVEP